MTLATLWLGLLGCAALIAWAGHRLCVAADVLAARTGLGHGTVGLALLAGITSMPELATGVVAAAVVGSADLALGDALGSCVFNLALLALVEAMHRGGAMYRDAGSAHVRPAAFGAIGLALVAAALLAGERVPVIGRVGLASPLLLAGYLLVLRRLEPASGPATPAGRVATGGSGPAGARVSAWLALLPPAVVVMAAGSLLPHVAKRLALAHGLGDAFAGTVLVAVATSLPELAVTVGAMRIAALDMAIANLLGSNLFNLVLVAIDDIAYAPGALLAAASMSQASTALVAAAMSGLVIAGLRRRTVPVLGRWTWIGPALVAAYVLNAFALRTLSGTMQ